jgi:hypothetical protein
MSETISYVAGVRLLLKRWISKVNFTIDEIIANLILLLHLKTPLFFIFFLFKVASLEIYAAFIRGIFFIIVILFFGKCEKQKAIKPVTLFLFLFVLVYSLNEFYQGATLNLIYREFINDFLIQIIAFVGTKFNKEIYFRLFKIIALINSIVVIIGFFTWSYLGDSYQDFLGFYGLEGQLAFRGDYPRLNGLFGGSQVASIISIIGMFLFLIEKRYVLVSICFLGSFLTFARGGLFMIFLGALVIAFFQIKNSLKKIIFTTCLFALGFFASVSYLSLTNISLNLLKEEYLVALNSSIEYVSTAKIITGNGFAIRSEKEASQAYIQKAPVLERAVAEKFGKIDYFEFAFLFPLIKHGIFYLIFMYFVIFLRWKNIDVKYKPLIFMLILSNFHYLVTDFYMSVILYALAARSK